MKFRISSKWQCHICVHGYIFLPGWNCMFVRPWNCRFKCLLSAHSESRYESLLSCSSFYTAQPKITAEIVAYTFIMYLKGKLIHTNTTCMYRCTMLTYKTTTWHSVFTSHSTTTLYHFKYGCSKFVTFKCSENMMAIMPWYSSLL